MKPRKKNSLVHVSLHCVERKSCFSDLFVMNEEDLDIVDLRIINHSIKALPFYNPSETDCLKLNTELNFEIWYHKFCVLIKATPIKLEYVDGLLIAKEVVTNEADNT